MNHSAKERPLRASIIICTFNRVNDLRTCLQSLPWEMLEVLETEVIVVDDGSNDATSVLVQNSFSEVRLLMNERTQGLAFARNQAAKTALGKLFLYLDDDVMVTPPWLGAMLAQDDGATLLTGRILDWEGDREQGGPAYATFLGKRLPCRPEHATIGTGCNLAIPAVCFEAIHGFDLDFPCYFDDSDFCIRARKAGFHFRYVPDGVVRHKGSERKRGEAIRMQEQHSTHAMLKAYRSQWGKLLLFTLGNGTWLLIRLGLWTLQLRFNDCRRLLTGWLVAHKRFLGTAKRD